MGTMNSNQMSKAVGSSISIINSSRSNGKAPGLQLQTPKSSGEENLNITRDRNARTAWSEISSFLKPQSGIKLLKLSWSRSGDRAPVLSLKTLVVKCCGPVDYSLVTTSDHLVFGLTVSGPCILNLNFDKI